MNLDLETRPRKALKKSTTRPVWVLFLHFTLFCRPIKIRTYQYGTNYKLPTVGTKIFLVNKSLNNTPKIAAGIQPESNDKKLMPSFSPRNRICFTTAGQIKSLQREWQAESPPKTFC